MRKVLAAAILILVTGSVLLADDPAWLRLDITLTTTSDWTEVQFSKVPCWVDEQSVESKGPRTGTVAPLAIHKKSMDATETTLKAVVYVQDPGERDLHFYITRGDIGSTTLSIPGVSEIVHDTRMGEPRNRKLFRITKDALKAIPRERFEPKKAKREKRVLAFYYPWYGSKDGPTGHWVHWDPERHNAATHTPELGLYDSNDEAVIRKHIALARGAGIDGFIVSWWGQGTFEDKALRTIMKVAEVEKFLITAYYEQAEKEAQIEQDVAYLVRDYGGSASWLRDDGQPVVFVYGRVVNAFPPSAFAAARKQAVLVMDSFDPTHGKVGGGMHTYNPVFSSFFPLPVNGGMARQYDEALIPCRARGLILAATVVPGYDDTFVRSPGAVQMRRSGLLYDESWNCATASPADWILICSWNEWHEGSEIEPSKELGDFYLKKTAEWVKRWK